jgi:hypothetical protein
MKLEINIEKKHLLVFMAFITAITAINTAINLVIAYGGTQPSVVGHSWSEIGDFPGTIWHSNNDGSGSGLDADSIDGVDMTGPHGSGYYHLGAWGVGRTDSGAVLVNTAYRADIASKADKADKLGGYTWNNLCYCIKAEGDCAGSGWRCARFGQAVDATCGDISGNIDWYITGFKLYHC